MKGRFYNPSLALEDFRDNYWNNGIYTIGNKRSESARKPKISFRDPKDVVSYNQKSVLWEASISPQWGRMKVQDSFKRLDSSSVMNQNTLAFLEETQKYIHKIRKPLNLKSESNNSYRVLIPTQPRRTELYTSLQDKLKGKVEYERIYSTTPTSELKTEVEKLISASPELSIFKPKLNSMKYSKISSKRIRKLPNLKSRTRLENSHLGRSADPESKDITLTGVCVSPNSYKDLKLQEFNANHLDNSISHSLEMEHTVKYPRSLSRKSARVVISKMHTPNHSLM